MNIEALLTQDSNCSGCGACENVCPCNALCLLPGKAGFLYPSVDISKCIECKKCIDVCSYKKRIDYISKATVYAAVSQNTDVRQSSSGGLFSSLATSILNNGGVVYGCTMSREEDGFYPHHIRITREEDLYRLQGSKYVQSEIGLSFRSVLEDLKNEKTVLFSGTPCQVDGLRGYLGKDYSTLYTIDNICHGVPNRDLLNRYIHFEEKNRNARIMDFVFRDKKEGWKLYGRMDLDAGKGKNSVFFEPEKSSYYQLFLDRYTYRENCYTCPFASNNRPGDITMGDFWNIDLVHPELKAEGQSYLDWHEGVSVLIVNSDKGLELMDKYGKNMALYPSEYKRVAEYNRQLIQPSQKPMDYDGFRTMMEKDYSEVDKWYQNKMRPIRIKRAIKRLVPSGIKKVIRKLRGG